jgi:hypothetical protein
MRSITNTKERTSRGARVRALGAGLLLAVAVTSCQGTGDLLSVQVPNSVSSTLFNQPVNATLLVNSGIGAFEFAFGTYVRVTGVATDELADATLASGNWPLDRRDNDATTGAYGALLYSPESIARTLTDQAITNLTGWTNAQVPTRPTLLATAYLYSGFTYATMGMTFCQAAFDGGPAVGQLGMFALAETRFDSAIVWATASAQTNILNAAYVGRARVRLFQHNLTGAASDAQLVPAGFVFNANNDATTARRYNNIYANISVTGNNTVEPASRALTTETGQADPRAATTLITTKAADGVSQMFIPTKYNGASLALGEAIPFPIARTAEAQLILAEVQGGAAAVTIINTMRAAVPLAPYTGATDAASITALIASERRRALFVEGFRFFDVERLNQAFIPAAASAYRLGGSYGATVCLPLPSIEYLNNLNIVQANIIDGVRGDFPIP